MTKGPRSEGRAAVVQLLYQLDCGGEHPEPMNAFFEHLRPEVSSKARRFARELYQEVVAHLDEVDELLQRSARNWRVERMSRVDRSILRVATHELTRPDGPPPAVVINEAVELAKAFGSEDSAKFVNGVLARVNRAR